MSWQDSLVRIAGYNVEQLRKRLAEVMDRRVEAELKLALLQAEAESESRRASLDAEAGWYRLGYLEGWRGRRDGAIAEIAALEAEEAGARDALAGAFEEQKKYELIAEASELTKAKDLARREGAALDELGGRRRAAG